LTLPFATRLLNEPFAFAQEGSTLTIEAGPRTDFFRSPQGDEPMLNAPAFLGRVDGDFTLAARVDVSFASTFDAGALMLWGDEARWAKLCFEFSPQREPMVVSVVTRGGVSDDANGVVVDGNAVWLRIARIGSAYAFHSSVDGAWWSFARHFALDGDVEIGVEAQSPTGEGCAVRFTDVHFEQRTLADLRDGS
jgi:regulation of enolase protein 1 (concanavalin A-like superfamily)